MRLSVLLQLGLCCCATGWGATLRASVIEDHSGHAVISAEMQIAKPGVAELVADLESDGNGKFETVDLDDGDYVVRFSKTNYIETSIRIRAASMGEHLGHPDGPLWFDWRAGCGSERCSDCGRVHVRFGRDATCRSSDRCKWRLQVLRAKAWEVPDCGSLWTADAGRGAHGCTAEVRPVGKWRGLLSGRVVDCERG